MAVKTETGETVTGKWSRLYGTLYAFIARAMLDGFGDEGERVLRKAIHDYGAYRAAWMRADHQRRGLALNLANLQNLGDMPNTDSLEKDGRVCTPSYFRVTVTECTHNDTWRALDSLEAGIIYCSEVHHPMYEGYSGGSLDLPDYLTKGDRFCTFELKQPGAPEPAAEPKVDTYPEAKIARLYGVLYCFLARAMVDTFGEDGEQALRQALAAYASHAVNDLGEDQVACGWEADGTRLQPVAGKTSVAGQAMYAAWQEVEGEGTPLGHIYFGEIHRSS